MLTTIAAYLFCLLAGVLALAFCAWIVLTGQLFTMDGLTAIAVTLAIAAFFLANLAWAVHTGEIADLIRRVRGGSKPESPGS